MDPTLIGAIIGAASAVVVQSVSAVVARWRESIKRRDDRQLAVEERFFPLRFERYGQFLQSAREGNEKLTRRPDQNAEEFEEAALDWWDASLPLMVRLEADLGLIFLATKDTVREVNKLLEIKALAIISSSEARVEKDRERLRGINSRLEAAIQACEVTCEPNSDSANQLRSPAVQSMLRLQRSCHPVSLSSV